MCDWVERNNGVRENELGFTLVDLNRIGHKSDPFILATQAKQVFYINNPLDAQWSVVLAKQPKDYYRRRLDEDDNESLVAHANLIRHMWNSHLMNKVNNDDHDNFL